MTVLNIIFSVIVLIMVSVLLTGVFSYTFDLIKVKTSKEKYIRVGKLKYKTAVFWAVLSVLNVLLYYSNFMSALSKAPDADASRVILNLCAMVMWGSCGFVYLEMIMLPVYISDKHIFGINGLFSADNYTYLLVKNEEGEEGIAEVYENGRKPVCYRIKVGNKQKYSDEVKKILEQNYKVHDSSCEASKYAVFNKNHLVICAVIFLVLLAGALCFYFGCRPLEWLNG